MKMYLKFKMKPINAFSLIKSAANQHRGFFKLKSYPPSVGSRNVSALKIDFVQYTKRPSSTLTDPKTLNLKRFGS